MYVIGMKLLLKLTFASVSGKYKALMIKNLPLTLSVDEQMIPYFGRHSCKMYMKGKPVRFGCVRPVGTCSNSYHKLDETTIMIMS